MPAYTTDDIRNVALVGHGGAGKTMLAEALAVRAGAIENPGSLERGSTLSDHEPEEKAHQQSLFSSVLSLDHAGLHLNIVDTPGYPDFIGRALGALAAVETVAVVVDARAGVQTTTRRLMELAGERQLARLVVVNRIDTDDVDFDQLMAQIQEAFGSECLPINLPTPGGNGVVDCFFEPEDGAATAFSSVEDAHTRIVDQVVEMDEQLMELYLEAGETMQADRLHDAFESALREGHLVPVCFTSAANGAGLDALLTIIERLMPSPLEANPPPFQDPDGGPAEVLPDPDRPLLAQVFKVSIDPFVGRLAVFRVYQGRINRDTQLLIGESRKPTRVGHLFRVHGKDTQEVDEGIPGDICAVGKIDELGYRSVLHDDHAVDGVQAAEVPMPQSMYGLAIVAASRGDEQKLSDALTKVAAEDPSFQVHHDSATGETVARGIGELHLRIVLERMRERFHVEVSTHPPRIAYRETITAQAEGHHRHKKQTGGAGQFGEVYLRVEPLERGAGFEFVDAVVGGAIPSGLIPAVEKGVRQVLDSGAVAGYPMQDVRVTVHDGKYHTVDSKEIAFVTAGRRAFLDAVAKARPQVLEPIVNLEVTAPQENMGDVAGDLSSRRGRINGTTALTGGMVAISAQAPLSEIDSYQSQLKSMTGGAGSYTIELSHYEAVPAPVQQRLSEEYRPGTDED